MSEPLFLSHFLHSPQQRGFTLAELAIVLSALGLITWAVSGAYGNVGNSRERDMANAQGQQLLNALKSFALTHARLPCPDTDGDGWEGNASGCPAGAQSGDLPYRTLGFDLPAPALHAAYAVYRDSALAPDADLVVRAERSNPQDAPGNPGYQDVRDLILALNQAGRQPVSTAHPYLTGNNGTQGAVDCNGNVRSNPAVVLAFPLTDRDASSSRFDGIHAVHPNLCFQAPGTPVTATNDDVTVTLSTASLAGWLSARAP